MASASAAKGKILCADVELRLSAAGERTLFLAIPGADVVTLSSVSDIEKKTKRREVIKALARACNQDFDVLWSDPDVHEEVVRVVHELAARLGVVTAPKTSKDGWKERILANYREYMKDKGLGEEPYTIEYGKRWYIAYHDGRLMAVVMPELVMDEHGERVVITPIYVGPIIRVLGEDKFVIHFGGYVEIVDDVDRAIALLKSRPIRGVIEHPHPDYPRLDVLIPRDDVLRMVLDTAKWTSKIDKLIDWLRGVDVRGVMRVDTPPQEAAKALERRQEVFKRYLGPNAEVALVFETLYLANILSYGAAPGRTKPTRFLLYLCGEAKRGKSTFALNVAEMLIPCLEDGSPLCKKFPRPKHDYHIYSSLSSLTPAQIRNLLAEEGPPIILDEVSAEVIASLIPYMLPYATGKRSAFHAARHGHGVIEFEVKRGGAFISNDPLQRAFSIVAETGKYQPEFLKAAARRFVELTWEDYEMSESEVQEYFNALYENTPAVLPLIADLLQRGRELLDGWVDTIDLAVRMCTAIEKLYGVNMKPRIEALRKLAQPASLNMTKIKEIALHWDTLYAKIKKKYNVNSPWGALANMIVDTDIVYHKKRVQSSGGSEPAVSLWKNVFRYRVDVDSINYGSRELNRIEMERRVAYGLFGWDWPQELYNAFSRVVNAMEAAGYGDPTQQVDTSALRRMHDEWLRSNASHVEQIELVKNVAQLILDGKYPVLKETAIDRSHRRFLGVERKPLTKGSKEHGYDVIPQFFKYVLGEDEESQEDEELSNAESEDVKRKAESPRLHSLHGSEPYTEKGLASENSENVQVSFDKEQNGQEGGQNNVQGEIAKSPSAYGEEVRGDRGDVETSLNALQKESGNGAAGQTSNATGSESSQGDTDVKNADEALRIVLEWARKGVQDGEKEKEDSERTHEI